MHHFLDSWVEQASITIGAAYSAAIALLPTEQEQEVSKWMCFAARMQGGLEGRFVVGIDRSSFEGRTSENEEAWADAWPRIIQDTTAATLSSLGGNSVHFAGFSGPQSCDLSGAQSYNFVIGDQTFRLRILDEVHPAAQPTMKEDGGDEQSAARDNGKELLSRNLQLLLDVELEASLRFGSRSMQLNEIMELGPGDVVQLERHIADPVDLIVGDKIVARGEVVLLNGNFGLRVSEVAEPRKRLETIRCLF
jgi:flagellar motor switch protein FliN